MKPRHPYVVALWCGVFFALVLSVRAQEAVAPRHTGVPHDWSQSHIVFSRDALARQPDLIYREPRVQYQAMQRWQAPHFGVFHGADPVLTPADRSGLHRDWNVSPLGGTLEVNMFPAKFSFNPALPPDCTNDYVVFGLNVDGATAGRGNLIAFNNLYSDPVNGGGFCDPPNGPGLTVLFSYNVTTPTTIGKIDTSPVLSEDGTKIAFVESIAGATPSAIFHVVTWNANPLGSRGTQTASVVPVAMTSVTFSSTRNDTYSSPWVDYGSDTAYVGDDSGHVHKITNVFKGGGPMVLDPSPWPVGGVAAGTTDLTPPVLDSVLGLLMVGSKDGNLYQINPALGTLVNKLTVGKKGATGHGILAAPVVDITNGTTFVVNSNNGTSAVLVEADTATLTSLAVASIGEGSASGTAVNLYNPAFDNNYYNNPSTGLIHLCGTGTSSITPYQYAFGFTVPVTQPIMNTTASVALQLPTNPVNSTGARCSGWTEFFNPYAGASDTITSTSINSDILTVTASNSNLTVGEEVYIQGTAEGFLNGQAVTVASLIGSGPTYTGFTANFTASNYTNATDTGTVTTGTDFFFFGLTQDCTGVGAAGGCAEAIGINGGTTTTTTVTVPGGPTGIDVDNYANTSIYPQASSIYFAARSNNSAYKYTQNGLN